MTISAKNLILSLPFTLLSLTSQAQVVTASSVEALNGSLSGVKPAVLTPLEAPMYLQPTSCLGSRGPISAYGPLGTLGPIGSGVSFGVNNVFDMIGDWSEFSNFLTLRGGPLSEEGPLGPKGPLGESYAKTLPRINDFGKQLQAGGVWTVLGPLGPLGALGPLGPLGPMGGHGFGKNQKGDYVNEQGQIQKQIRVGSKNYDLFEIYDEAIVRKNKNNDTSWMALGKIENSETDHYELISSEDQFVTVVLVPEKELDIFSLKIQDTKNKSIIAVSDSKSLINWAQFPVKKNQAVQIDVSLNFSGHWLSKSYRLIVVGSTSSFQITDIRGPHQKYK